MAYFDFNATSPLLPRAREIYLQALDEHWHNPSSLYWDAGTTRRMLEEARVNLASQIGVEDETRIVFTSGATESNHVVFRSAAAWSGPHARVAITPLEHPCVQAAAAGNFPGRIDEPGLTPEGSVDLDDLTRYLDETRPALVSVMAAHNETGLVLPWREIASLCREREIPFHCDAAQWFGKQEDLGFETCDWVTGSAHKFGGPKGVGFLVAPPDTTRLPGAQSGGPQENGLRGGTENFPAIVALEAALHEATGLLASASPAGRDQFEALVTARLPGSRPIAASSPRLWNTSMLLMPRHTNTKWLTRLSQLGFAVSTGSACSAGKGNPSRGLEALGLGFDEMGRVLRFSSGWNTSLEDWEALAQAVEKTWRDLENPKASSRRKRTIRI